MIYSITATSVIFISFFVTAYFFQKMNFLPEMKVGHLKERYYFIDGLRGIAAICVVVGHSWRIGVKAFDFKDFYLASFTSFIASFGVQLFFCITGFLFFDQIIKKRANFDWNKFYLSRVKRLTPLFLFSTTVSVLCLYAVSLEKISLISFNDLFNTIKLYLFGFGGQVDILGRYSGILTAASWTLPYEVRFYFVLPLACLALKSNYKYLVLIFVVLLVILSFAVDKINLWQNFLIGAFGAYVINKININNNIARVVIFCVGLLSLIFSTYFIQDHYDLYSFLFVFVFFISMIFSKPKLLAKKFLVFTGDVSYSIYLNHSFVLVALSYIFYAFFGKISLNIPLAMVVYGFCSIMVCTLSFFSFKYIEYPFLKKN
ncbi:acyltransferase family protein [Arsenophonus nasoniae]|uniref:Acyltransferase n=1 Tax=Arsenophonus nasoniae TaxID=638 RepID=A0AA95GSD4_9GAMM|nr:acyltransferase [Arsenophonus nasoniae]WGM03912.1 acyltransferase [Arsenophonus nasoniae]